MLIQIILTPISPNQNEMGKWVQLMKCLGMWHQVFWMTSWSSDDDSSKKWKIFISSYYGKLFMDTIWQWSSPTLRSCWNNGHEARLLGIAYIDLASLLVRSPAFSKLAPSSSLPLCPWQTPWIETRFRLTKWSLSFITPFYAKKC